MDLFLICPTVDMKDEYNMAMDDEETKASFLGALNNVRVRTARYLLTKAKE